MSAYQLAQLNIAVMNEPLDSPIMADFVNNLERINALAESSDGFVWRLQTDDGDATGLRPLGEDTIVNMSTWRDVASLKAYVYQSAHVDILRRRREWFVRAEQPEMVLWWVPIGHQPSAEEAYLRLQQLRQSGASPAAFNFRQPFVAPDQPASANPGA